MINGIGGTQQSSTHMQTLPGTKAHPREDTPFIGGQPSQKNGCAWARLDEVPWFARPRGVGVYY
jgi:hypothetical protein